MRIEWARLFQNFDSTKRKSDDNLIRNITLLKYLKESFFQQNFFHFVLFLMMTLIILNENLHERIKANWITDASYVILVNLLIINLFHFNSYLIGFLTEINCNDYMRYANFVVSQTVLICSIVLQSLIHKNILFKLQSNLEIIKKTTCQLNPFPFSFLVQQMKQ